MKWLKLILMASLLTIVSGCNIALLDKPVEVKNSQVAELARPLTALCWLTDEETSEKSLCVVKARIGYRIGRLSAEEENPYGSIGRFRITFFLENIDLKPGQIIELARPVNAVCWITNRKTKARELRIIKGQAGWYLGRLKTDAEGGAD